MSPSIFGRLVSGGGRQDDANSAELGVQDNTGDQPRPALPFNEVVATWRDELAEMMRQDLAEHPLTQLELETPHPGGLAQLYAEHSTKLSSLYRDEKQRARSQQNALELLKEAQRLLDKFGLVTLYLSIGTATWKEGSRLRSAPVLLRPVEITVDPAGEVYLALRPGIEISNRLLMALSRYGTPLSTEEILQSVRSRFGFSPEKALQLVREAGENIPDFTVSDTLTVGVFSHPTSALLRELGAPQWLSLSPVTRALAGSADALAELEYVPAEPNPEDRDPWEEKGLSELGPPVADALEAALGDQSVVLEVPSGADEAPMIAALAAEHAAAGQSVLVIASPGEKQGAILQELEDTGVTGVANAVGSTSRSAEEVQANLLAALLDASDPFNLDETDELRTQLRRRRKELSSYTESLHQEFSPWGVSAFDALQVLTDLTSIPSGPSTRVRLSREALNALSGDGGESARNLIRQAAKLGMFSGDVLRNWWTGVEILDEDEVDKTFKTVETLSETLLPKTESDMVLVSSETGLQLAQNAGEWAEQVELLRRVQASLDIFQSRIFERSAADMAVGTASGEWRKSRGIKLGWRQRRRLVKQAKDLLVPGANVPDLHAALVQVQELRERWRKHAGPESWPTVPTGLSNIESTREELQRSLDYLNPYLKPVYGDLNTLSMEELGGLMDALAADPEGARELPKRVRISGHLEALGLTELIEDLQRRRISGDALTLELDLSWWASALSIMLTDDPRLGGIDPTGLQEALADLIRLEGQQARSLGPELRSQIMRHRQQALAEHQDDFDAVQTELARPMAAPAYFASVPLSWDLMPIVLTAPAVAPQVVPWGRHVDVVILSALGDLPLPALIPLIARGQKVIVVGQKETTPGGLHELSRVLPAIVLPPKPENVHGSVVELLSNYDTGQAGVAVPSRFPQGRLNLTVVDGTGMPAPGVHAIESSSVEVEAIVQMVRTHAAENPEVSLGVVALNGRHADRIRQALRLVAARDETFASYLEETGVEPFAVFGPEEASGAYRDRVIVAVGYAKTPHGRMIHDFGPYSQAGGEHLLAQVLRVARTDLDLVASFEPEDVDPSRLRNPGALMLVDLLKLGRSQDTASAVNWPTLELAPDHLLVDLAERLYGMGLNVVPNLGVTGGLRIPLGIGHPEVPGELLVAILTDDEDYIAEPSLRVRDRLIPQMLQKQGWKVRTELSMAVFIDPNKEAEAIVQLVLDAVDEHYDRNPHLRPDVDEALGDEPPVLTAVELGLLEEPADVEAVEPVDELDESDVITGTHVVLPRHGRPLIAAGLPLSAYGDDQLDEVAQWILSANPELDDELAMEEIRTFLALHRRGAQSDAVLRNVVRRNRPEPAVEEPPAEKEDK